MPFPGPYAPGPFRFRGTEVEEGERPWHWTRTLMLLGFFACMLTLPSAGSCTVVSWTFMARTLTLFCILGLILFPWRFYQRALGINAFETFLFNVMGVGPMLFSLLLWSNFLIHGPVKEEVVRVQEREFVGQMLNPVYKYELEGGLYEDMPEFRRFTVSPSNNEMLREARKVEFRTARGLWGYRVILGRKPLR